jgi:beta-lactamase superfamily II metal-dependent hydrolase
MATTKKNTAKTREKTASVRNAATRAKRKLSSTAPRARVRMYRQGLGDCFLVTFPGEDAPFHMVIDCGVVLGTPNPETKMQAVVKDIANATGNHIDLLVVTHEHWDHVSGFTQAQAQSLFDRIKIDRVWLAWTEDPADQVAKKLRTERRNAENALRMAVARLGLAGDQKSAQRVGSIVDFFGAKSGSTGAALDYVKKRAAGKPKYCKPGEPPITISEVSGVRFWILGPPRDEKLLKKSNPSQGAAYGLDAGDTLSQAFFIAGLAAGMGAGAESVRSDGSAGSPFDQMYSIPLARAEHVPFFDQHYFGAVTDNSLMEKVDGDSREVRDQAWRRIDGAWLGVSEAMALQLDSATNNTSLVIAIELTDTGAILLFPGDAQAGNWMSWQDVKWEADKDEKRKAESGPGLLAKTAFYKVGHHGSHNATLKALGLELMTNSGLIAMIPVDHDMAVKKRWGKMPLPELVARIREKTEGRVLRVDDMVESEKDLAKLKPESISPVDWKRFTDRVTATELYFEISF